MKIRSALFITAGAVGAAIGGAALATALDDPTATVAPAALGGTVAAGDTTATPGATPDNQTGTGTAGVTVREVDGLDQLVGTLRSGDDPGDWYVSGVEVDFGPDGWISAAPAFEDYDGDGSAEPLLDELRGLDGREVTLGIRYEIDDDDDDDDDRDDADAFVIEGLAYRDATGGPAPWQSTPAGVEASREEVAEAAAAAVGEGAVAREVDRENEDGWLGWDVEVRGADGREYQVYLDLPGAVLDVRPDND